MGLSSSPGGFLPSEQTVDGTTASTTWLNGKTDLRQSGALTANRSTTLPVAKAFPPGTSITFIDGFTSGSFGRSFSPAGADTLNGGSSALTFFIGPGTVEFETDGVSQWTQLNAHSSITGVEDSTDRTKVAQFDVSAITPGVTRVVSVAPSADSITVIASPAVAGQFMTGISSGGVVTRSAGVDLSASNVFTGPVQTFVHIAGSGSAPTAVYGPAAGATPGTLTITGNDMAGKIAFTTGTSPTTAATILTVTYAVPYATTPTVQISPHSVSANTAMRSIGAILVYLESTTGFSLQSGSGALAASTAYEWTYMVIR